MHRTKALVFWFCAASLGGFACGDDSNDGGGAGSGSGLAGMSAAGMGAAGMGAAGMGAAGMGSGTPNMPDATCIAMAGDDDPTCSACACTPNAMGGCLTELMACEGTADAMHNMLCGAILDCARANGCTGAACLTPCMNEITAGFGYMSGAPTNAATAVGMCTGMSCAGACM